jgi:bacteriocin-like protein
MAAPKSKTPKNPKLKTPKKKTGPDALVANPGVTLTEAELSQVSGGVKLGDIKGESPDDKHKGEIEVLSIRKL